MPTDLTPAWSDYAKEVLERLNETWHIHSWERPRSEAFAAPVVLPGVAAGKIFPIKTVDGVRYPQFQFRTERKDVQPVIARLLEVRMNRESDMHLLGFLMSAHPALTDQGQDLGQDANAAYPASLIGVDDEELLALYRESFCREGEGWEA